VRFSEKKGLVTGWNIAGIVISIHQKCCTNRLFGVWLFSFFSPFFEVKLPL
jgi:hypothetical protein